jgi:tetratricopeptide (TPR) repeat protein
METRDIITAIIAIIAGLAFIFSIVNFFLTYRQRATENRHNTRKALTDVVAELTKVSIAYNQLELEYPQSAQVTIVNLRRNYSNQRRYLANHGEFLATQIPELTSDIDCITIAQAFDATGDFIRAQKFFELALDKSPTAALRMWNLRGIARFWFDQGNAQRGRQAYEEALQLNVPDTDSMRYNKADTYLLWSRIEDEHGYVDEAKRIRALGQQAANRIGNSQMRQRMLNQFSGVSVKGADKSGTPGS